MENTSKHADTHPAGVRSPGNLNQHNNMKKTLIAIIAALTIPVFAEVPKGVDRKWDSTLTVRVIASGEDYRKLRVTAKAPAGGAVKVTGNASFTVPAGKTITKEVTVTYTGAAKRNKTYSVSAYYSGKLLDRETNSNKTGLGGKGTLRGGGLGDRKKVGR